MSGQCRVGGVYTGVFIQDGERAERGALACIEELSRKTGKHYYFDYALVELCDEDGNHSQHLNTYTIREGEPGTKYTGHVILTSCMTSSALRPLSSFTQWFKSLAL